MAEFTEAKHLYEILIRVQEDGSYAAHYHEISTVLKDGEPLSSSIGPATPVDESVSEILEALVGEAAASSLLQLESLRQQLAEKNDQVSDLQEEVSRLSALSPSTSESVAEVQG